MSFLQNEHGMAALSEAFGVSTSGLHKARRKGREPGARERGNQVLLEEIENIHQEHKGRYGSPRITLELQRRGHRCGENRVARIMRENGIEGIASRRKRPRTTDSLHRGRVAPNRLKGLEITRPNQAWAMDITYVEAGGGFVYLAAVLDLFTRRITGWQIADHMRSELVEDALRNAAFRTGASGMLIHSDRGSQYCSDEFIELSESLGCTRSMSAKGNCYDNAAMESFFGVIKREELDRLDFKDLAEARATVFDYIEGYYNTRRLHTSIGMPPEEFARCHGQGHATPSAEFSKHGRLPESEKKPAGSHPPAPTHGRSPGYPSKGDSPASPSYVSPGICSRYTILMDVEQKLNY